MVSLSTSKKHLAVALKSYPLFAIKPWQNRNFIFSVLHKNQCALNGVLNSYDFLKFTLIPSPQYFLLFHPGFILTLNTFPIFPNYKYTLNIATKIFLLYFQYLFLLPKILFSTSSSNSHSSSNLSFSLAIMSMLF